MHRRFNDSIVNVNEVGVEREMAWGERYRLYEEITISEKKKYYVEVEDGSYHVDFIGEFESLEEAEDKACEYWDSEADYISFELKEMREELGISMKDMAKKFDIPYRTYQNWETGLRTPAMYVLKMMKKIIETE